MASRSTTEAQVTDWAAARVLETGGSPFAWLVQVIALQPRFSLAERVRLVAAVRAIGAVSATRVPRLRARELEDDDEQEE